VSGGHLSSDDIAALGATRTDLQLSENDVARYRVKAYERAFAAVYGDQLITDEEDEHLIAIQRYLNVQDGEIASAKRVLEHARLLRDIQRGELPTISVPGLVLQKAETSYWSEPASILEERVVKREYVGGSRGMSFRIAKGVHYHVGSFRGHIESRKAVVPVSRGSLVITSKRLLFLGDSKSFSSRLDKLLETHLFRESLRVEDGSGRPHVFRFESTNNIDVVGAILSHAINAATQ